jgi:hypothetical protein
MKKLNFPEGHKMVSNLWDKKGFQTMLRSVRKQGLIVEKLNGGYTVCNDNVMLLKAMNGSGGYLVRCIDNLFD